MDVTWQWVFWLCLCTHVWQRSRDHDSHKRADETQADGFITTERRFLSPCSFKISRFRVILPERLARANLTITHMPTRLKSSQKITFYAPGHFICGRYEQNLWCCSKFARIVVFKTLNMPEMCPTSADLPSSLMMSHIWRARACHTHVHWETPSLFRKKKDSTGFHLHRMHEYARQKRYTYQNAWI